MTKKKVVAKGKAYTGSKQNGGRKIVVEHYKENGKWKTTSRNAARHEYEKKHGKLPRGTDVDHVDNNKNNDSAGNLRAMSHGKNVGKENKRRAGKKKTK
jgi:HNH endonuclease